MQASITRPLEEAMTTIPDVRRIRSKTQRGSTEISVDFAPGTDVIVAEQLMNAKVNEARPDLPPETRTEVERMNPTVFPVLGLTISSPSLSQASLWNLATYTIKPRLARAEGVARVVVQGGRMPEIEVSVRPEALAAAGLSLSEVVDAIDAQNGLHAVGRLDREFKQYQVTVTGEATNAAEIGEMVVAERGGKPLHVRELADVAMAVEDRTTIVSANGSESVLINIIRQPTANSVAMVDAVHQELAALKSELPPDAVVGTFYDQSILVKEAVGSVRDAVLIGAVLSVFVLMLFLRDLRATVVTAAIIPATLLITFLLMRLAGMTLNLMTLGALAVGVGLVIDDAIVVVESVVRHFAVTSTVAEAVRAASTQIAAPMVSSTLTTVVVFLPLAFLKGVEGAFFSALAVTLSLALMVSLILALCVSPSLCAAFLKRAGPERESGLGRLQHHYGALLNWTLARKWVVAPVILATALGTWWIGSRLETGFMPAMDEGSFVLDYWTPPGTALEESDRLLKKIDAILLDTPEIQTFSRRTGTELGFMITEPNTGDYAVMLKQGSRRHIEDVIADIRARVEEDLPGMEVEFIQVLQDLIGDLAGNPEPIEVKLFGEDKAAVEGAAVKLADRLGQEPGIVDINPGLTESGPEIVFDLDPAAVGRLGMIAESIAGQAEAAMLGTVATNVRMGDRLVPVRVRLPMRSRSSLAAIERLLIVTPKGRVPLSRLGTARIISGTTQDAREDQRRLVGVTARMEGIDLGTAVREVRHSLSQMSLPPGVTAVLAGQFQSQQESFRNLAVVLGAAILLVYLVMLFQFKSFGPPGVILVLMPLSLFGAVLALGLTHTPLNVSSFMGVIMLAGIVVKNGILLLDRAQRAIDGGMPVGQAVVEAGEHRLRPILMTTLTAILGLVPLALGIGAGAEMQQPLAIAVIGGLAFSTVLTLVIGPALFASLPRGR
ncbi:MAG: efflux RND transporter permease subunit, partial [Chthonomonadaceae bacterium]|nr:efflux RND transporter permease subunit [Chthonomonadaceae bacterium]